jgi:hypothetical protein
MKLIDLWNHVVEAGYNVRKSKCNGQNMWQPFKNLYSKYQVKDQAKIIVNNSIDDLIKQINYVKNEDDSDHLNVNITVKNLLFENKIEIHHFIIQHFRIPLMEKNELSLVKLLQIAYNVGQAQSELENKTYDEHIIEFYNENKLNKLETFIDPNIANSDIVTKQQIGGYEYKYNKYKAKYKKLVKQNN